MFSKNLFYYFVAIPTELVCTTMDLFIIAVLSCALTRSQPAPHLSKFVPNGPPFGCRAPVCCLWHVARRYHLPHWRISWFFLDSASHCRQFDGNLVDVGKWWEVGQNYEAEMLALLVIAQLLIHAAVINTGFEFRRSW